MYLPFDMKKLALIMIKGNGLLIVFGSPKKAMSNLTCPIQGGKFEFGSYHGVSVQKKRTLSL
jgi:hypothetical protein